MEFTYQKHNDLWTTHHGNANQPNKEDRNLHVQTHKSNDDPRMERGEMVPGKTAIYDSTTANPENMDREDTCNDNAHANKGQKRYILNNVQK